MCELWNEYEENEKGWSWDEIWHGFIRVAKEMHTLGFLPDDEKFHFCHLDFNIYNFLGEVHNDSTLHITGVLDWDTAVFAPKFVACRPPYYFWMPADEDECDEDMAVVEPLTDLDRELKQVFLETASAEFQRHAFFPEHVIARRIFNVFQEGLHRNSCVTEAEALIDAWDRFHGRKVVDPDAESDVEDCPDNCSNFREPTGSQAKGAEENDGIATGANAVVD